jgi:hypothetical protein
MQESSLPSEAFASSVLEVGGVSGKKNRRFAGGRIAGRGQYEGDQYCQGTTKSASLVEL